MSGKINLPTGPSQWSREEEDRFRRAVGDSLSGMLAAGADLYLVNGERLILKSPNGNHWALSASNVGVLTLVAA